MAIISVEIPDEMATNFINKKVVKYEEILDYEDNLKYSCWNEKVNFKELSDFLWDAISSKN